MTTLVTGGRGFVGRHLVNQLIEDGERVISYNRDFAIDDRDGLFTYDEADVGDRVEVLCSGVFIDTSSDVDAGSDFVGRPRLRVKSR